MLVLIPTMPCHTFQTSKKSTSSAVRAFTGLQFGRADQKKKVVKASNIHEQMIRLEERKKECCKFQQLSCN